MKKFKVGDLYIWNDGVIDHMVMIVPSKNGVANWVGWCAVQFISGSQKFQVQHHELKPIDKNGQILSFTKSEQPIIILV